MPTGTKLLFGRGIPCHCQETAPLHCLSELPLCDILCLGGTKGEAGGSVGDDGKLEVEPRNGKDKEQCE